MNKTIFVTILGLLIFPMVTFAEDQYIKTLSKTDSDEYGGSIKVDWEAVGVDEVRFTFTEENYGPLSGVSVTNAKTGEDFPGVTNFFDAKGAMYFKIKNYTPYAKRAWVVLDANTGIGDKTIASRKILTIEIPASQTSPDITSLSPQSGPVGTIVTINGSGYTKSNNSVSLEKTKDLGVYGIKQWNLSSEDGKTLKIEIPKTLSQTSEYYIGTKEVPVIPGKYQIIVSNDNGKGTLGYFTVTKIVEPNTEIPQKISVDNDSKSSIQTKTNLEVKKEDKPITTQNSDINSTKQDDSGSYEKMLKNNGNDSDKEMVGDESSSESKNESQDKVTETPKNVIFFQKVIKSITNFFFGWFK